MRKWRFSGLPIKSFEESSEKTKRRKTVEDVLPCAA